MTGHGPMTGRVFGGRYEVGERIGIGGMAEVYSAQDTVLGRIVAIKVMLPQYAEDPDFARRFRQEAAAAANLQSPYIVNVYDWGHDEDTYFIVMEYIRGSDLKTAIQQRGPINQRKVAEIGTQVCQALTVAHKQDIIHRDIKPQNIMIQPDGNVKVMDFGIARAKNSTSDKTQTVLGTAHYASPEQAQGKDLTATSDIYSLGVVLYEAATGTLPFDGPDAVSVALMQVQNIPPAPHEFNPDIDPDLEAIIMTAMEKDPNRRFATANDMRLALNNYLAGRPVGAASNGFTSAKTQVIAPIGAAAGSGVGETQVMPVTQAAGTTRGSHAAGQGQTYRANRNDEAEAAKKKKRNIIIAVVAVVAIAIIGAVLAFGFGGERIEVPDVLNKPAEEAQAVLEEAGFKVEINNVTDDTATPGTVVNQNPKAGSQAPKGSTVTLDISQGTEDVDIPSVVGMTVEEARKALATAGFTVGDTKKEYSDDVEEGKIISQDPAANGKAKVGTKINLVVSQGSDSEEVPDLEGLSIQAARSKAEGAGFVLVEGSREYSDVSADLVLSQSPAKGTKLKKGSSITVTISNGKKPDETVTVPGVMGDSEQTARNKISNQGLSCSVKYEETSDSSSVGKVIDQSPSPQQKVNKGTTVTIVVGKASSSSSTTN